MHGSTSSTRLQVYRRHSVDLGHRSSDGVTCEQRTAVAAEDSSSSLVIARLQLDRDQQTTGPCTGADVEVAPGSLCGRKVLFHISAPPQRRPQTAMMHHHLNVCVGSLPECAGGFGTTRYCTTDLKLTVNVYCSVQMCMRDG